jgi:hypothetical protein
LSYRAADQAQIGRAVDADLGGARASVVLVHLTL